MAPFKYPKLYEGNKSFRLIRLHKGTHEIECNFELAYLDGGKEYDAVSYVWGDSARTYIIKLGGRPFVVSEVVVDILLRLRKPNRDRLLWIDLLCIDQDNSAEKGLQVERMRHIFSQAQTVIASIGPHYQYESALGRGNELTIAPKKAQPEVEAALDLLKESDADVNRDMLDDEEQEILLKLLEKPWFDRVWVIQEAAVARKLRLICGKKEIDGSLLRKLNLTMLPLVEKPVLRARMIALEPFLSGIAAGSCRQQHPELLDVLQDFRSWKAEDPRDKVYALLGVSSDGVEATLLKPDYNLPVEMLYQRVSQYMISRYSSLLVLTYIRPNPKLEYARRFVPLKASLSSTKDRPKLPSWSPDWRVPYGYPIPPAPAKRAEKPSKFFSPDLNSAAIKIEGIMIGVVKSVFHNGVEVRLTNPSNKNIPGSVFTALSEHLQRLSSNLSEHGKGGLEVGDEICVLSGSTGIAILRPRQANYTLIILEHSQFSQAHRNEFYGDHLKFRGITGLGKVLSDLYSEEYSLTEGHTRPASQKESLTMRVFNIV